MRLGLGLGLGRSGFIKRGGDPVIEALIKANCTMYLDPNKANGTSKGINAPLTSPLKDLIGSNDATLVNFAGKVDSGYDEVTELIEFSDDMMKTLKPNQVVVNGIVDLEYNLLSTDAEEVIFGYGSIILKTETTNREYRIRSSNSLNNGTYTIKIKGEKIIGSDDLLVKFRTYGNQSIGSTTLVDGVDTEITFDVIDNGFIIEFTGSRSGVGPQETRYSNFSVFEGLVEPTPGVYELGNSKKYTKTFLKSDVIDDYGTILNNASLDPTGTEDFAYFKMIKTSSSLVKGNHLNKSDGSLATTQYGVQTKSDGSVGIYLEGSYVELAPSGTLTINSVYSILIYRISSVLKCIINESETYNLSNTTLLTSRTLIRDFARPTNIGGTTHTEFTNDYNGPSTFFYNGATGLNETDIDNACALLRAPYF